MIFQLMAFKWMRAMCVVSSGSPCSLHPLIALEADGELLQVGVGVAAVVDEAVDEAILGAAIALLAGKVGEVTGLELAPRR